MTRPHRRTGAVKVAAIRGRGRWLATRVTRALRVAAYWQALGDLDEAARAAHRALRLARRPGAIRPTLTAEAARLVPGLDVLWMVANAAVSRVKQKTCIIYTQCLNVLTGVD